MENETIFRIMLPLLLFAFIAHRGYYTKKNSGLEEKTIQKREEGLASKIAGLLGMLGFAASAIYVVKPDWIAWAALPFPLWMRWSGMALALVGFALLQWAQATLSANWSDTPRMMKAQELVTRGPYGSIRHPIYSAFILIIGSMLLISANGIVGLPLLLMAALEIVSRMEYEENLMIQHFGDVYRQYMTRTGRLFPRLTSTGSST